MHDSSSLIVNSYHVSAARIRESLRGGLGIKNTRLPGDAPGSDSTVRGLCSQGGRHPYFEVRRSDLESACEAILFTDELEKVHQACEQLRAMTWFNANTGCVNDINPDLVPLMPPEEVWCDGHEIALDVWRLLSFDSDQLASAIHHGFEPTDIGLGSLSYHSMAFANMMRECGDTQITFDVAESGFTNPASPLGNAPQTASLRQLFLEAGVLLTPADPRNLAHWYAAVRYLGWIDSSNGDLRVRDSLGHESIDTRYRGLFSEELAIGMMAVLLRERYGASVIANTSEYHAKLGIAHDGPVADFVADGIHPLTGQTITIVAESKGSLRQKVPAGRKKHAKSQIAETPYVVGGSQQVLGIAFASSLRYGNQKHRSFCEVIDPEPTEPEVQLDLVEAYRVAYAKALRFVGFEAAARQVYMGQPATALPDPDLTRDMPSREDPRAHESARRRANCREEFDAELVRDLGSTGLMIDRAILHGLRAGINSNTLASLRGRDRERRGREGENSFMSGIGIGISSFDRTEDDRDDRGRGGWQ